MDSDYEKKYLKYKAKYLELKRQYDNMKGGLVGDIPISKLKAVKKESEVPAQIKEYIDLMRIPGTEVIRVGSNALKIQPYFSDIDIMNIVSYNKDSEEVINIFINNLKKILENILTLPNVFFSDFKAGGLHWTVEEIMNGTKDGLGLNYACKIKGVVKLDLIAPYDGRYVEMSTFYILKGNSGYINVNDDYFSNFENSLKEDIVEYKDSKPFKAVKRVWSLARMRNDLGRLNELKNLINSNVALLGQINADLETIKLLLEHGSAYDLNFVISELNGFKGKISNILDIQMDEEKIDILLDLLINQFTTKQSNRVLIATIDRLHDYILEVINKETNEYLTSINFTFPIKESEVAGLIESGKKPSTDDAIIDSI